ncbi:MAG: hypothetical protein WD030_08270, partial [Pirellulales bacterium]
DSVEKRRGRDPGGPAAAADNLGQFEWTSHYSTVDGSLPAADIPQVAQPGGQPLIALLQFGLQVTTAGTIGFDMQLPEGATVWFNGEPLTNPQVEAARGDHRVTFAFDPAKLKEAVRVELLIPSSSTAKAAVTGGK